MENKITDLNIYFKSIEKVKDTYKIVYERINEINEILDKLDLNASSFFRRNNFNNLYDLETFNKNILYYYWSKLFHYFADDLIPYNHNVIYFTMMKEKYSKLEFNKRNFDNLTYDVLSVRESLIYNSVVKYFISFLEVNKNIKSVVLNNGKFRNIKTISNPFTIPYLFEFWGDYFRYLSKAYATLNDLGIIFSYLSYEKYNFNQCIVENRNKLIGENKFFKYRIYKNGSMSIELFDINLITKFDDIATKNLNFNEKYSEDLERAIKI